MNIHALYHKPESEYAYATSENSLRIVLRTARGERLDAVRLLYDTKYDFIYRRAAANMEKKFSDKLFDYYISDFTLADVRFAYIFELTERGKVWYFSEAGLTETYDFDHAYYTFFQFPYINRDDVVKVVDWAYGAVFYQIFVDRFCRGDFTKDDGYTTQAWDAPIEAKSFCGGDLKGITSKLDYLTELGVNALYLTPVFRSNSNHKYNAIDYLEVDPMFGTKADLKELTYQAHKRGMKLVLDAVFNHCDEHHPYFADVLEKGRESKYFDWFMIRGDKPDRDKVNYECFADCGYMPKWDTNNPAVQEYVIGLGVRYVTEYGFDGLRLDVSDEISHKLWRDMRAAVKAVRPDALILGEVWHENTHYLRGDQFDGVMNYKLQKIFIDYFAERTIDAQAACDRVSELWLKNAAQVNYMMLNFLDNHDTPRFLRYANGDKDAVLSALAAMVMHPGMPCVFYGTELPIDGGGDPDCRKTFDWTYRGQDKNYIEKFKQILRLKKQAALQTGDFSARAEHGLLALERRVNGQRMTAYFNQTENSAACAITGKTIFENRCEREKILPGGVKILERGA